MEVESKTRDEEARGTIFKAILALSSTHDSPIEINRRIQT
jgi:hypothetical protein